MKQLAIILLAAQCGFATDFLSFEIGSPFVNLFGQAGSFSLTSLNGSTLRAGLPFQCREAMTINGLGFRYGARTGTPPTYRISLQGLDATGQPDGTVKGGGSPVSTTFTPPADTSIDGLTQLKTPDNNYTCTRGELLAIVIDYSSGTVDGSNFSSFTVNWTSILTARGGFLTSLTYNGSVWTKSSEMPMLFYTSTGSKTYGAPVASTTATARSSGAESAMFFAIPASTLSTYQVRGARMVITTPAAAKEIKIVLYSGTTVLQTLTVDSDYFGAAASSNRIVSFIFNETTLSTLTAGTTYRIGVSPQDASNNVALTVLNIHDAQALTAFPGAASWGYSTRTGCGAPCDGTSTAWTDDSTARPLLSLILGDVTAGSGQRGYPIQ